MFKLELEVQEPYYTFIKQGQKTVEGRLAKAKYLELKKGDLIKINDLVLIVNKVREYSTFREMLQAEGFKYLIPNANTVQEAVKAYYKFYTKQDEEKWGVVAILFSKLVV